jgi:hypothetical protein
VTRIATIETGLVNRLANRTNLDNVSQDLARLRSRVESL